MISAVGTNSDTKRGKESETLDQCLGEKRENYLENSVQQMPKAAAFLAHPGTSVWFWPRLKGSSSDHGRLRRAVQTGTSNPTGLP